jgi:CheY-like chemotaxis protein
MAADPNSPLVLIADDEKPSRDLLRMFLENAGYRVVEATNGTQALELARTYRPALAMLDVRMSGLDGFEVSSELKADDATRSIRVALISAANRQADYSRAEEVGADAYLYKLTDWSTIMKRVAELLRAS